MRIAGLILLFLATLLLGCFGQPDFPTLNQQCADDAGPIWADEDGTELYHDGSAAEPVLVNGDCSGPVSDACTTRGDPLTAYLEGPISCNGDGWYCRILMDENWPPQNLDGDLNFGYCNQSWPVETDQDGHCHGGSDDSTFYWWVRDHWFRGYNGRLRCCCGWNTLSQGGIVNRCDYRRLVTDNENCRDANEDHTDSYEGGCNEATTNAQDGQPIPEDDSKCWEVQRFGHVEEDGEGDGAMRIRPLF